MSSRSRSVPIIVILLLLIAIAFALVRCARREIVPVATAKPEAKSVANEAPVASASAVASTVEKLTPAEIQVPARIDAGATFRAAWSGPDNAGDYLTIVKPEAKPEVYTSYRETRHGSSLDLTAPIEAGEWEVRYVTVRSKTVLGRTRVTIVPTEATISAPAEVTLGSPIAVEWTGPNNAGDFITIVAKSAADQQVGSYVDTQKGSPLSLPAPVQAGTAEIRYVTGQGRKVLARREIAVLAPNITLTAPASVLAGARFALTWQGPANAGDYLTIVAKATPDGQYGNYADTSKGSPLELVAPIAAGDAEIRYMTGREARVLARRAIAVLAAEVSLIAAETVIAGSRVNIEWTGPNNSGDFITIVAKAAPDGQSAGYTNTTKGSPLAVLAPMRTGEHEIRYMSGQGAKVLARRPLAIEPATISLQAPAEVARGATLAIEWKGPNNPGDYITLVPKPAKDGVAKGQTYTLRGSPAKLIAPNEAGEFEIRYMSGQQNLVLSRTPITVR
jgi:hypothetical protein